MAGRFRAPAAVKDPLLQKIPANPKYQEVRPKVDTGASVTKYLERVKEIKSNYKYKKGELFKRIKVTSLVGVMIEVAEMNGSESESRSATSEPTEATDDLSTSSIVATGSLSRASTRASTTSEPPRSSKPSSPLPLTAPASSTPTSYSAHSRPSTRIYASSAVTADSSATHYFPHPSSYRRSQDLTSDAATNRPASSHGGSTWGGRPTSSLLGLVAGVGERSSVSEEEETEGGTNKENASASSPILDPPYLLLDIREEDAFRAGHIRTAENFPTSRLSRAFQFETRRLRSFCNQEGKIIVVYDEDETMAPRAATILVERGYENVFMLSGGINVARKVG